MSKSSSSWDALAVTLKLTNPKRNTCKLLENLIKCQSRHKSNLMPLCYVEYSVPRGARTEHSKHKDMWSESPNWQMQLTATYRWPHNRAIHKEPATQISLLAISVGNDRSIEKWTGRLCPTRIGHSNFRHNDNKNVEETRLDEQNSLQKYSATTHLGAQDTSSQMKVDEHVPDVQCLQSCCTQQAQQPSATLSARLGDRTTEVSLALFISNDTFSRELESVLGLEREPNIKQMFPQNLAIRHCTKQNPKFEIETSTRSTVGHVQVSLHARRLWSEVWLHQISGFIEIRASGRRCGTSGYSTTFCTYRWTEIRYSTQNRWTATFRNERRSVVWGVITQFVYVPFAETIVPIVSRIALDDRPAQLHQTDAICVASRSRTRWMSGAHGQYVSVGLVSFSYITSVRLHNDRMQIIYLEALCG